jgi:hypothetical protein
MMDCGNQLLYMNPHRWEHAIVLRDLLWKAFNMTKNLQFEGCSPGYFYRK